METYFASPERSTRAEMLVDLELISQNPVINGLMNVVSGFFAVLNQHRQVITLNRTLLDMLHIDDVMQIIGLRPGEALDCIHADVMPAGCGTSEYCPTCGAAIAIVTSLEKGTPSEKFCSVQINKNGHNEDLYLRVKSYPIDIEDRRFLLLFLQDISYQQKLAALERIFFHDISNMVSGLVNSSHQLQKGTPQKKASAIERISVLASRLANEIDIQRSLLHTDLHTYQPDPREVPVAGIIKTLKLMLLSHPAANQKKLHFESPTGDLTLRVDFSMLTRVICNMVINALEASAKGEEVIVSAIEEGESIRFCVWNKQVIPEAISKRIFQRNYSTKKGQGRGLGTYSMKLLGEEFLGGKVDFKSSEQNGTEFSITLMR